MELKKLSRINLKRKSLDELAKTMEVVGAEEQAGSIGGNSVDGTPYGWGLSGASDVAKRAFIEASLALCNIGYVPYSLKDFGPDRTNIGGTSSWMGITINSTSSLWDNANSYDFALVLIHESHHQNTLYDMGTIESEIQAYEAMMDSPYYQYASETMKESIANMYVRLCNGGY